MVFHGYGFEHTTVPNGAAATGDYGSELLFRKAAGNIDLLCSPFSYVNRRYLAPTMTQVAAESAILRGIMPLDEDYLHAGTLPLTSRLRLHAGTLPHPRLHAGTLPCLELAYLQRFCIFALFC
jgi:hypothetical protein